MRLLQFIRHPEVIGPLDCPLMLRWTLLDSEHPTTNTDGESALTLFKLPLWLIRDRKLMVHHFLPNIEERDFHDHPRAFWTFVLRGRYFDLVPCKACKGLGLCKVQQPLRGFPGHSESFSVPCMFCERGRYLNEVMSFGNIRYRAAKHTHITQAAKEGAWTLVWMLPLERGWGFWRGRQFWPWREYKAKFGFGMQCPSDQERESAIATWDQ